MSISRLIQAQRCRTAFHVAKYELPKISGDVVATVLEGVLRGEEDTCHLPDAYHIREAIKRIEEDPEVDRTRLARIQFGFIHVFRFDNQGAIRTLMRAIMSDPALFVELLSLVYKPASQEERRQPTESERSAAHNAWEVLDICTVQPGTDEHGNADSQKFAAFVHEARERAVKADRLAVCDISLGQILARGQVGADDVFPFEPAREVLDRVDCEDIRRGFHTGCYNKPGVTTRWPI